MTDLPQVLQATKDESHPATSHKIGLIGGLAPRAGIFYYEQLLRRYKADGRTRHLSLSHADLQRVLACVAAGDKAGLGHYLAVLADELFAGGASLVAVTAVAPHLAMREMAQRTRSPIVNVLPLIGPAVEAANLKRVAVFGNRTVMQTNIFGAIHEQAIIPLSPSVLEEVHDIYTRIALEGKCGTEPERTRLDQIAGALVERSGAEAIVLAGTDLSAFYSGRPPAYPFLDVAQLHIAEIVRRARRPFAEPPGTTGQDPS